MERDEIQVYVTGLAASGKSVVQLLIADALRDYGFDVKVNSLDHPDEDEMRRELYGEKIDAVVEKNRIITVNEVMANRNAIVSNGNQLQS